MEAKQPDSDHSCLFPLQDDEGDGMFGEESVEQEIDGHLNNVNIIVVPPDAIHHQKNEPGDCMLWTLRWKVILNYSVFWTEYEPQSRLSMS